MACRRWDVWGATSKCGVQEAVRCQGPKENLITCDVSVVMDSGELIQFEFINFMFANL